MKTSWLIEDRKCEQTMGQTAYFEAFQVDRKTPGLCFEPDRAAKFESHGAALEFLRSNFPENWGDLYDIRPHEFN